MLRDLPSVKFFSRRTTFKLSAKVDSIITDVLELDIETPWKFISISDGNGIALNCKNLSELGCKELLFLSFDDATPLTNGKALMKEIRLFNDKQAETVIEFLNEWKWKEERLFVHCDAGYSRSAAVAFFAVDYCGGNSALYFESKLKDGSAFPNWHVYKQLCKMSYLPEFEKNLYSINVVASTFTYDKE